MVNISNDERNMIGLTVEGGGGGGGEEDEEEEDINIETTSLRKQSQSPSK